MSDNERFIILPNADGYGTDTLIDTYPPIRVVDAADLPIEKVELKRLCGRLNKGAKTRRVLNATTNKWELVVLGERRSSKCMTLGETSQIGGDLTLDGLTIEQAVWLSFSDEQGCPEIGRKFQITIDALTDLDGEEREA